MQDPFSVTPFQKELNASVQLPGSKSITNRALVLAALAKGETTLQGALFSRDTKIMLKALETLGFEVSSDETCNEIKVTGCGGNIPSKSREIHVGNAGTAARFLTAMLAREPESHYTLDGDPAMRERPMAGLLDALEALGSAQFHYADTPKHFPFSLSGRSFRSGKVTVDASASSQILSALLIAGSPEKGKVELSCPDVRPAYVAITLKMREAFGAAPLQADDSGTYTVEALTYKSPGTYSIEPDISAASYFLALSLIQGGLLRIANLGPNPLQGDAVFAEVLAHHGLRVDAEKGEWIATRPTDEDIQRGHREIDFNAFSDTFLTYAAIAPLLGQSVRITGIGHTRRQETDRIAGMAAELSKLGQLVKEEDDALTIQPKPNELRARAMKARNRGELLTIDTYEDHRFAMSFGILGTYDLLGDGKPWLAINDPACCGKTFPSFFDVLEQLRNA